MLNKINASSNKYFLIISIALVALTFAVFWQVHQFDFVNLDDYVYVKENIHIQSGITVDGLRWAFSTTYAEFWHPLTWLSLMLDYQLYGLNASGYHFTNLILHILSTLLLFWLFNRMTGALWRSAFVAALFALHPLHVESVAWIAERKDVLCTFFWMLTLCLYLYYTEKPIMRRYFLVLFSFACALMSKSIVITMPVIMILLDYWPLKRFELKKCNFIVWQLKEKAPFFVLSAIFSITTLIAQPNSTVKVFPLVLRLANASVSFVTYLEKTVWPHNLAVFYPFPSQISLWQIFGALLLIIIITLFVILMVQRLPYLFVGWLWYSVTLLPVIGIIPVGNHAMADRYHYLPSIGLAVMLAWGIPALIKNKEKRKKMLFPTGLAFLAIMAFIAWQQCGFWKNSVELFNHTVQVTKNNYFAHDGLGIALLEEGKFEEAIENFSKAIRITPDYLIPYVNRGNAYEKLGQYQKAIDNYNKAIFLKSDYVEAYITRGSLYEKIGQYQKTIEDYSQAIRLKEDYYDAYNKRGIIYGRLEQYQLAIEDFNKAIRLKDNYAGAYNNRGFTYYKIGQYQRAIADYNKAITYKSDYADAYSNRAVVYLKYGNSKPGCLDAEKACELGNCKTLEAAKGIGYCR